MSKEALEIIKKESQSGTVEELFLDDIPISCISPELKKEIEKQADLMCLSLNNCGLTSLANFPSKPALIRLELMENKFPAKDLHFIGTITSLQSLSLGSNTINSIEDVVPLKALENLIQLDLSETGLSKTDDYRKNVFELIPNLQVLDNLDVDGNEYEYSSDEDGEGEDGEDDEDNEDESDDEEGEDDGEEGEEGDEGDEGEEGDEDDEEDEDDEDEEEEDEGIPANKRRK